MKMKLYDAAGIYFRKSLENYPESGYACLSAKGLGESLLRQRLWAEASEQLQKVIDTCPDPRIVSHARELLARAQEGLAQLSAPPDTSGAPDSANSP
jgi:TolA-binding protein